MLTGKRVLLIIGGGIAAYKVLFLIRLLKTAGAVVTPVMTEASLHFVTALSVSALAGEKVHRSLFDLSDESEMGHIQLSRVADWQRPDYNPPPTSPDSEFPPEIDHER